MGWTFGFPEMSETWCADASDMTFNLVAIFLVENSKMHLVNGPDVS